MAKINEIDITSLTFQEGAAPATPAATKWKVYTKTDGIYVIDDAGAETGPLGAGGGGAGGTTVNHALGKSYTLSAAPSASFADFAGAYIDEGDTDWAVRDLVLTDGYRGDAESYTVGYLGWSNTAVEIRVDLEAAQTVSRCVLFGQYDSIDGPSAPVSIKLEYSSNDTDWTTEVNLTSLSVDPAGIERFSRWIANFAVADREFRYWRISFGAGGAANWVFCSEIELWGT